MTKWYDINDYVCDYIMKRLPHGSGIDSEWDVCVTEKHYRFTCSYHCMNDGGYYDGWQDFTVLVPKGTWENFKLQFNAPRKEKYIWLLRDYLEDIIVMALREADSDLVSFLEK